MEQEAKTGCLEVDEENLSYDPRMIYVLDPSESYSEPIEWISADFGEEKVCSTFLVFNLSQNIFFIVSFHYCSTASQAGSHCEGQLHPSHRGDLNDFFSMFSPFSDFSYLCFFLLLHGAGAQGKGYLVVSDA